MKNKPYTNNNLFRIIVNLLKEKELLPDILDYDLADNHITEIKTCEWDCMGDLTFGNCEGIYLDLYAVGDVGKGKEKVRLGVFKTLNADRDSFRRMAQLQADFIWEMREFVNEHIEEFNWTGCDVEFFKEEKKTMHIWVPSEQTVQTSLKRRYKYDFDYAIITNNENGKQKRVNKSEIAID